jgi:hemoglobin
VAPQEAAIGLAAPSQSAGPDTGRPDLDTRSQIHDLVVTFYRELIMDEVLGPVFEDVAEVDWSTHIPLLIDFWCRALLGHQSYQGTILAAHRRVHEQDAFTADHFDRWYGLWAATIDQRSSGPLADKARDQAAKVARSMARQLPQIEWEPSASSDSLEEHPSGCPATV